MKTKDELNALKAEVKALNEKLASLTEEELEEVSGGTERVIIRDSTKELDTRKDLYENIIL